MRSSVVEVKSLSLAAAAIMSPLTTPIIALGLEMETEFAGPRSIPEMFVYGIYFSLLNWIGFRV